MTKGKKIIVSIMMACIMFFTGTFATNVFAAGSETLPIGEHNIGSFTFTNTNLTPVKTMPSGAQKVGFLIRFKKADTDRGIGQVKLTVQIRNSSGQVVAQRVERDISGYTTGVYRKYTPMYIGPISVSPGEKYQIFFDASSVNPAESNGNYRSISIISFLSYVNVDEVIVN